jgi:uncharacterized Zn-binding protein involved in type VI secretion
MPGVALVFTDLVGGTGIITGPGSGTVLVQARPVSLIGDTVSSHGEPPHTKPVIITGSATVRVDGRAVTVQGISQATCGHPVTTGSATVIIGI